MYSDFPPEMNAPIQRVLVIEDGDSQYTINEIVEEARDVGAVFEDNDGDEIFCIVFAEEPRQMWHITERSLLNMLARKFGDKQGIASE